MGAASFDSESTYQAAAVRSISKGTKAEEVNMIEDAFLLFIYIGGFTTMLLIGAGIVEIWERFL